MIQESAVQEFTEKINQAGKFNNTGFLEFCFGPEHLFKFARMH